MSTPTDTVLVVDDTPANLGVLLESLGSQGYNLLVAENGAGALSQLEHARPDLILLDVMMPGLDGFEVLARLKANPARADIPVLLMTSLEEADYKVRGFARGAVDYITKPFAESEVLARVRTHLEISRLRRSLADELALRLDAENQIARSLDRAVVVADATGAMVFASRLAEDLLHRHCADYVEPRLPPSLAAPGGGLLVRRFEEPGRSDLTLLILEEHVPSANPKVLMTLGLTPREAEVLFWIAQGKSNPDIATILGTGVRTIHKHVENIFRKLGCETRAAAALTAQDRLRAGA
jgi:DNA-binding NarL/FixJ family response regulator